MTVIVLSRCAQELSPDLRSLSSVVPGRDECERIDFGRISAYNVFLQYCDNTVIGKACGANPERINEVSAEVHYVCSKSQPMLSP